MKTYGIIAHIDLTTGKSWNEPITQEMRRLYVGGRGISARLLYDLVPRGADPLGPHKGETIDGEKWELMLDEYYLLRGWDSRGVPTRERLSELHIDGIALV